MATILDGKGLGYLAAVNPDNHLRVRSVTESVEHYINEEQGRSFSIRVDLTPTGADDVFVYLKNTGPRNLILEQFEMVSASAEAVDIVINSTGTPSGGTAVTPANLNTNSSQALTGTFETGVNITGLTKGATAYRIHNSSATDTKAYNFEQDIVIGQGGVVCFHAVTGGIALDLNINLFETRTDF